MEARLQHLDTAPLTAHIPIAESVTAERFNPAGTSHTHTSNIVYGTGGDSRTHGHDHGHSEHMFRPWGI